MKYYKIIENGVITMIGSGSAIHDSQTEITKAEYDSLMTTIQNKPEDTFESVCYLAENGMYEARERTEDEKVEWFVEIVELGTITIDEVPEEYQEAVRKSLPQEEDATQTAQWQAGYDQAVMDMLGV